MPVSPAAIPDDAVQLATSPFAAVGCRTRRRTLIHTGLDSVHHCIPHRMVPSRPIRVHDAKYHPAEGRPRPRMDRGEEETAATTRTLPSRSRKWNARSVPLNRTVSPEVRGHAPGGVGCSPASSPIVRNAPVPRLQSGAVRFEARRRIRGMAGQRRIRGRAPAQSVSGSSRCTGQWLRRRQPCLPDRGGPSVPRAQTLPPSPSR